MQCKPSIVLASALVLFHPAPASSAEPSPRTLDALMSSLRSIRAVRAPFRETKHISLLTLPLRSEGRIYYQAPGRFARETTKPIRTRLVIDGDRLLIADDSRRHEVDTKSSTIASAFVGGFLMFLRGDRARVEDIFLISFEADASSWRVRLIPRALEFRRIIGEVGVRGRGAIVEHLEVRESSGDRTETEFFDVELDVHYTDADLDRHFGTGH